MTIAPSTAAQAPQRVSGPQIGRLQPAQAWDGGRSAMLPLLHRLEVRSDPDAQALAGAETHHIRALAVRFPHNQAVAAVQDADPAVAEVDEHVLDRLVRRRERRL